MRTESCHLIRRCSGGFRVSVAGVLLLPQEKGLPAAQLSLEKQEAEFHFRKSPFKQSAFLIFISYFYTLGNFWPRGDGAVYLQPPSSSALPSYFFFQIIILLLLSRKRKVHPLSARMRAMVSVTVRAISSLSSIDCVC